MFLVENSIPLRNGIILQGHFTPGHAIKPGDQLLAEKDGRRVGMVRFVGIINANFLQDSANPRYHLSVAFEGPYQALVGATLRPI